MDLDVAVATRREFNMLDLLQVWDRDGDKSVASVAHVMTCCVGGTVRSTNERVQYKNSVLIGNSDWHSNDQGPHSRETVL